MKDERYMERMETVSNVSEQKRVLSPCDEEKQEFEYKYFCKEIIHKSKREMDACFLMPLKLYHKVSDIRSDDRILDLEEWMKIYVQKGYRSTYFWLYLCNKESYDETLEWNNPKMNFDSYNEQDMKQYMEDVSKVENATYIRKLFSQRDNVEYWVLSVYEFTIRHMFQVGDLSVFIDKSIKYLNECGVKIETPTIIELAVEKQNYVYMFAANLFLLILRLRFGVETEQAIEWYSHCSDAYLQYYDWMLEEYIRVVEKYSIQSFERFCRMKDVTKKSKNKYAAKEVGDVYRYGMVFQDNSGARIIIEPNVKEACDYYRICADSKYIPALISAIQMEVLEQEEQINAYMELCLNNRNQASYLYSVQKNVSQAHIYMEQNDSIKTINSLEIAASFLEKLDESYALKYVLKNEILTLIHDMEKPDDIECSTYSNLVRMYSENLFSMDEMTYMNMQEDNYLKARKLDYFEAEYQLTQLFAGKDDSKYTKYLEEGVKKGCIWCEYENILRLKECNSEEWIKQLMKLCREPIPKEMRLELIEKLCECDTDLISKIGEDDDLTATVTELSWRIEEGKEIVFENLSCIPKGKQRKCTDTINRFNRVQDKLLHGIQDGTTEQK